MTFNYVDAQKNTVRPLLRGVFKAIATSDMLTGRIPMMPIQGSNSWTFNREGSIPDPAFVGRDASSVASGEASFDNVAVAFRHIVHDLLINNATMGQGVDQKSIQVAKALKGLGRKIGKTLVQGRYADGFTLGPQPASWTGPLVDDLTVGPYQDSIMSGPGSFLVEGGGATIAYRAPGDIAYGDPVAIPGTDGDVTLRSQNPNKYVIATLDVSDVAATDGEMSVKFTSSSNEFDGMLKLCPASQTLPSGASDTDGADIGFDTLNALLYEMVKVREDLAFVANAKIVNKIRTLLLGVGGTTPMIPIQGFGEVPSFEGVPILTTDWIPSTEVKGGNSNLSSLFLVSFDPEEGFYGAVQSAATSASMDIDPREARVMGVQMYEMGQNKDRPADQTRVEWFGAAGLGSELAIARASELKTA